MKRLTIAVIVAALAWAGVWWWSARAAEQQTRDWLAAREAAGWAARVDELSVSGFPNRIDRTLTGLTLADPDSGLVWEAPFVQLFQLVYNPGHIIAAFPDSQTLTHSGQALRIDSEGLRASLVLDGDLVERANAEAVSLTLTPDKGQPVALADVTAALIRQHPAAAEYRLAVQASALAGAAAPVAGLPDSFRGLRADLTVTLDAPLGQASLTRRPQPTALKVTLAEYRYGDLELKMAGALEIDAQGLPSGEVTLKAVNWRQILQQAAAAGHLPEGVARSLEQVLGGLAALSGNRETLDLPLTLRGGQVWAGFVPLGPAPRLRL